MYKTVENDINNPNVLLVTFYDSIEYTLGVNSMHYDYNYDIIIQYNNCRPWKIAVFYTVYIRSNAEYYESIKWETKQQQVYNEQLNLYRCPIYTRLNKVTDHWDIGDKYCDRRDYAHLLTKI